MLMKKPSILLVFAVSLLFMQFKFKEKARRKDSTNRIQITIAARMDKGSFPYPHKFCSGDQL